MNLEYVKHKEIDLRTHPDFSEVWLHNVISEDASILGLGSLELIQKERIQYSGGRLDLLLSDGDNTRFEVEVMLGPTDPSHMIRCIEYWDIERRRYPAYDHIAVLIAEQITNRFLNVMSLFAGSIPFVAIQLNALQIESRIVLDFVKVLDQRALREDDSSDQGGEEVTRTAWISKVGKEPLELCDTLLSMVNEISEAPFGLKYKKKHIALTEANTFRNLFFLTIRKNTVIIGRAIGNADDWQARFEDVGIAAETRKGGTRLRVTSSLEDLRKNEDLFREYVEQAIKEYQS